MSNPSIAELVARVRDAAPRAGRTSVVLIDGPAGSGKTSLACRLVLALGSDAGPAPVVHGDDIYEGWTGLDTMWPILGASILEPLARGEDASFRRWDWGRGERGDEVRVAADVPYLVIEGVGVAQRAARPYASLTVFVDAPWRVRLVRGIERDGEALRDEWERWQAAEAPFLEAEGTREAADVIVDGAVPLTD